MKAKSKAAKKSKSFYEALSKQITRQKKTKKEQLFSIGEQIRSIRFEKGMKAVEVCERAGNLDPRTLNALEKGRIKNPTLETLQSLARGLSMPVSELLRKGEMSSESTFYQGTQKGAYQVQFQDLGVKAVSFTPLVDNFFCGKLMIGAKRTVEETLLKHPFPIYVSVLVGRFEVTVEDKCMGLREGESVFFQGNMRHAFHNPLRRESVLLMMTAPSFFK